jgi:hypothetical protein
LLEVLSLLNLEDFQLNQWIFLMDCYNIQKATFSKKEMNKVMLLTPPEYFQPYTVTLFEENTGFDYTQVDDIHITDEENMNSPLEESKGEEKVIRNSSYKQYSVLELAHVGAEEAEKFAISLKAEVMQTYSTTKCTERTVLSTLSAEQMIEKDFIDSTPIKE